MSLIPLKLPSSSGNSEDDDFQPSEDYEDSNSSTTLAESNSQGSKSSLNDDDPNRVYALYLVVPLEWTYCKMGVTCQSIDARFGTYYPKYFYKSYPLARCRDLAEARCYEKIMLDHFSKWNFNF
jgi:hypothetical protein